MTEDGAVDDAELLTIGAFAARARLSPKALRLYDRLGLLPPAHVDGPSGYRYYRADQAERARLVAQLRQLDMPLALIAEVVSLPGPEAAEALSAYWAGVEERLAGQRTLADYLRGRLSGRSSDMYGKFTVETTETAEQFVITESRHTLADHLPTFIGESLGRLEEAAREHCGGVAAVPYVAYHAEVTQESDGPAESCVPVADPAAARSWAERYGRGVRARTEPATRLAYTRITKAQVAYPQIIAAFEAVEEWIASNGLEITGPCRELYFTDWTTTGPDDPACDVAFPVAERPTP
ncbi:MerR family transcriptional regulator [Streptomyces triticagri]|uniref:MerR family transcriptional regulator n=1 Tax=Streptomyces triticagri TaxID=2293568 RepID=A0A372M523_9ACTN|nr:MerR family transcriptional regulator [Streptomyces triticagri]RFU86032.1 MerR family transcriptional regulator [Streptomyces triticagri]